SDWFIAFKKAGKKVAFTPSAVVDHKPGFVAERGVSPEYKAYRNRADDREYFVRKHNLDFSVGFNGRRTQYRPKTAPKPTPFTDVDFLVTTFVRYDALRRCVLSIAKHYPFAKIY